MGGLIWGMCCVVIGTVVLFLISTLLFNIFEEIIKFEETNKTEDIK